MAENQFLAQNQPLIYSRMKNNFKHERLAHAYLFEGDNGSGKDEMAIWMAKRLLCLEVKENEPCEHCLNCQRITLNEHPNVRSIQPDGQTIKVAQIRRLQADFAKSAFEKGKQIFIIKEADKMNSSAANSLLKFLEEPQGNSLAILETNVLGKILPTIRSRCQIIHFNPLSKDHLIARLKEDQLSQNTAELLASLTNSYEKAVEISENEWFNETRDIVSIWFNYLQKRDWQGFIFIQKKMILQAKEKEQQQLILKILLFYFQQLRDQSLTSEGKLAAINQALELILNAQQKLLANVPFQGVVEQLTIRIIRRYP